MAIKVESESSNGRMGHIIEADMHRASEMEMVNFLILKIKQKAEDFGRTAHYKDKVNMFKKAKYTNVFGQMVSWLHWENDFVIFLQITVKSLWNEKIINIY